MPVSGIAKSDQLAAFAGLTIPITSKQEMAVLIAPRMLRRDVLNKEDIFLTPCFAGQELTVAKRLRLMSDKSVGGRNC